MEASANCFFKNLFSDVTRRSEPGNVVTCPVRTEADGTRLTTDGSSRNPESNSYSNPGPNLTVTLTLTLMQTLNPLILYKVIHLPTQKFHVPKGCLPALEPLEVQV